jgi:hypothetical protein
VSLSLGLGGCGKGVTDPSNLRTETFSGIFEGTSHASIGGGFKDFVVGGRGSFSARLEWVYTGGGPTPSANMELWDNLSLSQQPITAALSTATSPISMRAEVEPGSYSVHFAVGGIPSGESVTYTLTVTHP